MSFISKVKEKIKEIGRRVREKIARKPQEQPQKEQSQEEVRDFFDEEIDTIAARARDQWKQEVDVSAEVGKRHYTEGQKNYIRALKVIESRISKGAADLAAVYGSDDIEELANQYYISDLRDYSQEELEEIEREFNKTHGYHIRIKEAKNPFAGIDFLNWQL